MFSTKKKKQDEHTFVFSLIQQDIFLYIMQINMLTIFLQKTQKAPCDLPSV